MKYTESLKKLGLTTDQAKIYELLLGATTLPARLIAQQAKVGRELTYVVLKQLETLGLVERSGQGKIILFGAKHPSYMHKIVEQKQEATQTAEKAYKDILGTMTSEFNVAHHRPFIKFYEGLEGLQKSYEHILRHAKKVYVIRSFYDYEHEEIRMMVNHQLEKQAEKGVRSYVLSPLLPHMKSESLTHNMKRNITRKVIPKEKFLLPSQIMIYNNTVSITSMRGKSVTTIIEDKDIAETFLILFNYMWDQE